jgi:hypothetical protein
MARKTPLEKARAALGALTPDDLERLKDEISDMLTLYEQGGVVSGWGFVEFKLIRRKHYDLQGNPIIDPETGKQAFSEAGPYVYIRRRMVDRFGRQRWANVGYYGRIPGGLTDEQRAGLLKAHNEGGQIAGEQYLIDQGIEVSVRRWESNKAPEDLPIHPLGAESKLAVDRLDVHPLFRHFSRVAPQEAAELRQAIVHFWNDLDRWKREHWRRQVFGPSLWRTTLPTAEIKRRRFYEKLKSRPRPRIRVSRARKRSQGSDN